MSVFTLVAFLNLTAGCSANKNFSFGEVRKKAGRKIKTVVLPKIINGVQLPDGEEIIFAGNGAIFDRDNILISGLSSNGDSLHYDLHDVTNILVKKIGLEKSQTYLLSVDVFMFKAGKNPWKTINGRSTSSGEVIVFDKSGGKVEIERNLISGTLRNGNYVEFNLDEIYSASTKEFNTGGTLVALGLTLVILSLIAAHTDVNWDQK